MDESQRHGDDNLRGIGFMLLGVMSFSTMDALAKWLVADFSVWQILVFRGVLAIAVMVPLALWRHGPTILHTARPAALLLRGTAGVGAMLLFFLSLRQLHLADAVALGFAGAIFLTALSVPLLAERVGLRRWSAVLVGFAGVLVIVQPGSGAFQPAALLTLGAALLYALMMIMTRALSRTESSLTMVIYHSAVAAAVGIVAVPFVWVTPGWGALGLLVAVAAAGVSAQYFVTQAFRYAPVALLAPFDYMALIAAATIGFVVWNEVPGANVWGGAALLVTSGLYIVYREVKLRRAVG